jgi:autotransporter-associated beta strand protein
VPVSSTGTELDFNGSGATAYTSTNNIGSGSFTLNEIQFNSTATVAELITGTSTTANTLTFAANGSNAPTIVQNNTGAFNISTGLVLSGNLTFGGSGSGAVGLTSTALISGSGTLTFNGANTTTVSSNNSNYTGAVVINSGTVLGGYSVGSTNPGGPFGTGQITVNAGATVGGTTTFAVIGGRNSTKQININGGTWATSYAGAGGEYFANINMTGGSITGAAGDYIRDVQSVSTSTISTNAASTSAVISANLDLTFSNLAVNVARGSVSNGQDLVFSGFITQDTGAGSGAKSLTLTGPGTMVLSGSGPFSYAGGTIVNSGTLLLSTPTLGSTAGLVGVTIAGGATLSTADGTIQTVTLNSAAGSNGLSLGDSSSNPANLKMDLGDSITTPGTATINSSGLNVSLSGISGFTPGGNQILLTAAGGLTVAGGAPLTLTGTTPAPVDGYAILGLSTDADHLYLQETAAPASAYWNGTTSASWSYYNNASNTSTWVNSSGTELGQTPGTTSDVFFTNTTVGPGGLTTTLNANFSINSLTFTGTGTAATSPVTIAGPGSLTLLAGASQSGGAGYSAGTGLVVDAGSGSHTISANVILGGAQSWTNNSVNPFTVSGNISGGSANSLTLASGSFTFAGNNSYSGATNITGGSLTYTGSANSSGASAFFVGGSYGAVLNMNSTGTVTMAVTGTATTTSNIGGPTGTVSGAISQNSGTVSLSGSGYLFMGDGANNYGSYTLSGGTLSGLSSGMVVGYDGLASVVMTGGTMSLGGKFYLGDGTSVFSSAQGVATFAAGTLSTNNVFQFGSGGNLGYGGALNLGTLGGGTAVLTSTGTGSSGGIRFNTGNGAVGSSVNLNHGTLSLAGSIQQSAGASITATLNFDGGTLKATASGFNLIDSTMPAGSVVVYPAGANIDVSGTNSVTIASPLTGATGNGVYSQASSGVYSFSPTGGGYAGAPLVSVSTSGSGSGLQAVANISNGAVTGVVLTNPGQGYAAGDSVTFNFTGGGDSSQANSYTYTLTSADLIANTGGGLTKLDTGTLILSASNTYTGPTNISAGTLQVGTGTAGSIPNTPVTIGTGAFMSFGRTDTALSLPNSISGSGGILQIGTVD